MCSRACTLQLNILKCCLLSEQLSAYSFSFVHDQQYLITAHQTSASKCSLRGFGIIACLKRNSSHCCQALPLSLQISRRYSRTAIRIPKQQRLGIETSCSCAWDASRLVPAFTQHVQLFLRMSWLAREEASQRRMSPSFSHESPGPGIAGLSQQMIAFADQ